MRAQAQLPGSAAAGGRRPGRRIWFDPRFAIGLALVILSVVGVSGIVAAAGASTDVLSARGVLTPGEHVTTSDFLTTSVRAGGVARLYLRAADIPIGGVVVTRVIAQGELVPRSAVGSEGGADLASVVIPVTGALASPVTAGARVDLWSAVPTDDTVGDAGTGGNPGATGSFDAPAVLVPAAIVVRILDQKPLVAAGSTTSVELLVPRSSTADVLDAIANGAALSLVPADHPLGQ